MSLSTEHLRRALQNQNLEAEYHPEVRRSPPWCPPPPLSWWTRLDPTMKLAVISAVVGPIIAVLATWTLP